MSVLWTASDAVVATGGTSTANWTATGVSIDTRSLTPGDLFVALTDQRDGHDFVAQAFKKGAAAALVSRIPEGVTGPCLVVPDVLNGLEKLAIAARARCNAKVIAVTGSVGKTGSKEMLRTALSVQGRTHAAEKSYNNQWGVPLTLARMPSDTEFAVIEIGMNAPGEIAPLSRMARPHVALITTVAAVHLAAFENVEGIAREKASVFEGLEPGGIAILNRDLETYPILRDAAQDVVLFGTHSDANFRLRSVTVGMHGTTAAATADGQDFLFKINAPGRHLAFNALGVLAAVVALGGDLAQGALALAGWEPPEGRGAQWQVLLGSGGVDGSFVLIDESYNANPLAVAAALEVFVCAEPEDGVGRVARGRRIAFLGDMLELGDSGAALHAGLADLPEMAKVDLVHCAGPLMRTLYDALPMEKRGQWRETTAELALLVPKLIDAGDVVMAKGSLGSKVGLIVDAIKKLGDVRALTASGEPD